MSESNLNDLRWIRIMTPMHIPTYLVEQVRDRNYTVEDFYKYQELNCMMDSDEGKVLNPFNHLYVIVDPKNLVKGFLWFIVEPLTKVVVINTFSMDKEYWYKGKAVKIAAKHIKELLKKLKLKKSYWLTRYPKHSERHGYKRSKSVLMEYTEEANG